MQFDEVVAGRRSVKTYDPTHTISDDVLRSLFEQVELTPTSFNLQHTRFVVVRDKAQKASLRKAAYDQELVELASAVVVVLGKLSAHEDAEEIYIEAPDQVQKVVLPMIERFYADHPAAQRDEAIRSAALAAMTLMLAAQNMGYATCPMIGYDPDRVAEIIGWPPDHIPVMLVVIGKQVGDMRPRPMRLPLNRVVQLESWGGAGL